NGSRRARWHQRLHAGQAARGRRHGIGHETRPHLAEGTGLIVRRCKRIPTLLASGDGFQKIWPLISTLCPCPCPSVNTGQGLSAGRRETWTRGVHSEAS